jgi:hypothetical protein
LAKHQVCQQQGGRKEVVQPSFGQIGWIFAMQCPWNAGKNNAFIQSHKSKMLSGQNMCWQYTCSKIKEVCKNYWLEHHDLPHYGTILQAMKHETPLDDDGKMAVALWYFDKCIPAACLEPHVYGLARRGFQHLSTLHPANQPHKPYITPATKAFFLVVYHGCWEPWLKHWNLETNPNNVGKNIKEIDFAKWKKEHPGQDPSSLNSDQTMYINKPEYHNKYTKGNAGQVKYGGWSKKGLEKFNSLKQLAKAGWKHANCQPLEEKILEKICKIHEITASNYLDHLNATCRCQHRHLKNVF